MSALILVLAWTLSVTFGVMLGRRKNRLTEALFLTIPLAWIGLFILLFIPSRKIRHDRTR